MANSQEEAEWAEADRYHEAKEKSLISFIKKTDFAKFHLNNKEVEKIASFLHSKQGEILIKLLDNEIKDLLFETDEKKELKKIAKRIKEIIN